MISRFFKRKPKKGTESKSKKAASEKPRAEESRSHENPPEPERLLTAEGWKRMMMRKSGKGKK